MPDARARRSALTFDDVSNLAAALPGVEVGTSYGTPALKVRDKGFAWLWEDGTTLVLKVPFVVRDHLLATAPVPPTEASRRVSHGSPRLAADAREA